MISEMLAATSGSDVSNWRSILTIAVFFVTTVAVIFPFSVPLPRFLASAAEKALVRCRVLSPAVDSSPRPSPRLPFNFLTVPLAATLFLIAVGAVDGDVIKKGIVGANGVSPLDIFALFLSLAYISISLDATGLLRFLAFWVAKKGGTSGRRLYFFFYVFFLLCGILMGNDAVILSSTAFLAYFTRITGITLPTAWIFAQFAAANMASAVLVSSNITNLVLTGSFSLSFLTYTSSVILPFLAAALAVYPFLQFALFRSPSELIPRTLEATNDMEGVEDPYSALVDPAGAIFGSVLLIVTLAVLIGTSVIGEPVWEVTIPPAIIMLARDTVYDWRKHRQVKKEKERCIPSETCCVVPAGEDAIELRIVSGDDQVLSERKNTDGRADDETVVESAPESLAPTPAVPPFSLVHFVENQIEKFAAVFPTVRSVCQRLPIPLIPFAVLMFILVQAVAAHGWVNVFASWWGAWVRATGFVGSVFGMAVASGLLCNICGTNIGTTILLARTLQIWENSPNPPSQREAYGARTALALGSNFGAFTFAFAASLAGLLWRGILGQKGIRVRRKEFALLSPGIWVVATLVGSGVLVAQCAVVYHS